MHDDSAADLAVMDEILQVMFWMRGEHIARAATAAELGRMIAAVDEARIAALLEQLAGKGLVAPAGAGAFALTESGIREGGRRFADDFADLTKPGHGECGDPDCDCRRTGSPDDCRHHARQVS